MGTNQFRRIALLAAVSVVETELRIAAWLASLPPIEYKLYVASGATGEFRLVAASQDPEAIAAAARLVVQEDDRIIVAGMQGRWVARREFYAEPTRDRDITWRTLFYLEAVRGTLTVNFI